MQHILNIWKEVSMKHRRWIQRNTSYVFQKEDKQLEDLG